VKHRWTGRAVAQAAALAFALLVEPAKAFYSPTQGRWLSRDPLAERGGLSLYQAMANCTINKRDPLGMKCEDFAGGFTTHGEQELIKQMRDKGCAIPKLVCKCCDNPNSSANFNTESNIVYLCKGQEDHVYQGSRRHELRHAYDCCMGQVGDCHTFDGMKQRLCSEIRAYCWGSGMGVDPGNRSSVVDLAVGSVITGCIGYNSITWQSRLRPIADAMFDSCCNRGGAVTDPLPVFPPELWPPIWGGTFPSPPKHGTPNVCKPKASSTARPL
jgi:RHS repeat-associated protein